MRESLQEKSQSEVAFNCEEIGPLLLSFYRLLLFAYRIHAISGSLCWVCICFAGHRIDSSLFLFQGISAIKKAT